MSMQDQGRRRRRGGGDTLRAVAAAPAAKGKGRRKPAPAAKGSKLRRGIVLALFGSFHRGLAVALFGSVLTIGVVGAPRISRADYNPVPEIDPSSMAGALTMLVGGFLVLTDRARRSA